MVMFLYKILLKKMRIYKSQAQVILEGTFKGQDTT